MYNIIKNVISRKAYNFTDILAKIDTLWSEGKLADTEREELIALAQSNASIENSVDVAAKLVELEQRIKALESSSNPDVESIKEYDPDKWYYNGDRMIFEGDKDRCTAAEGVAVYWSPKQSGLCWEKHTPS